jgi:DNA-binding PadR family transcriptional regulator
MRLQRNRGVEGAIEMGSGPCIRPPLGEPTFLILLGLFKGPRHGWGLHLWVSDVTGGRVQLRGGALFDNLHRLLKGGYVLRVEDPQAGRTRRRRSFYALTEVGRALARAEMARIEGLGAVIQTLNGEDHHSTARMA